MSDQEPIVFQDADEARAWDRCYAAAAAAASLSVTIGAETHRVYMASDRTAVVADAMLRERRKRVPCPGWVGDDYLTCEPCTLGRGHEGECQP